MQGFFLRTAQVSFWAGTWTIGPEGFSAQGSLRRVSDMRVKVGSTGCCRRLIDYECYCLATLKAYSVMCPGVTGSHFAATADAAEEGSGLFHKH